MKETSIKTTFLFLSTVLHSQHLSFNNKYIIEARSKRVTLIKRLWSILDGLNYAKNNEFDLFLISSTRHLASMNALERLTKQHNSVIYPNGQKCGSFGTLIYKHAFDGILTDLIRGIFKSYRKILN